MAFQRGDFVTMTPATRDGRPGGIGRVTQVNGHGIFTCQPINATGVLVKYEASELAAHTAPAGNYNLPALDTHFEGSR